MHDGMGRDAFAPLADCIRTMIVGGVVEIEVKRESKTRAQEAKFNVMIRDIERSVVLYNQPYTFETWKAYLVDDFEQEMKAHGTPLDRPGDLVMSRDGQRAVAIRPSTTGFLRVEAGCFIEYLYATGIEMGARFTDKAMQHYEEEMERRAQIEDRSTKLLPPPTQRAAAQ
jgi:hypothetical protein